jgi:hypothetical protein
MKGFQTLGFSDEIKNPDSSHFVILCVRRSFGKMTHEMCVVINIVIVGWRIRPRRRAVKAALAS